MLNFGQESRSNMESVLDNEEHLKEEIFEDIAFSKAIAEGEELRRFLAPKFLNNWRRQVESQVPPKLPQRPQPHKRKTNSYRSQRNNRTS
jgi:hypothetical protein